MNGSNPKQPKFTPPAQGKRRRVVKLGTPWALITTLFVVYILIGLLLSMPEPPFWVWITSLIAIPLLIFGCNRPLNISGKRDFGWILAYLGALLMAVTLAVAVNYIGSDQSFETVRFFTAIAALAGLTLGVVILTGIAAIVGTAAGRRLLSQGGYARSMTVLMSTCFFGICLGGLIGLAVTTLN